MNGLNILVDIGMSQGRDPETPMSRWPIRPSQIDYLFLTHAHIDHIGRVPELIQKGFNGEIICSHPTKALLNPMLTDAMKFSDLPRKLAIRLEKTIDDLSWGFEFGQRFDLEKGVGFTLKRAGHILGSAFIQFWDQQNGESAIFSGDIGAADTPILRDPEPPDPADLVVMESTYGNRLHPKRDHRIQQLGQVLTRALVDGGIVFIPAFSLGRTQELIYEMDRLFSDPAWQQMFPDLQGKQRPPVFIDSPLGLEITKVYARLSEYWDEESRELLRKGDHPIDFDGLFAVKNHKDHLILCDMDVPAVILAGSGMCTGGRIVNHLKNGIDHPENNILFVGYQAAGTPGRDIQARANKPGNAINLNGERKAIKASVDTLAGYSAHADQKGLLNWIASMPRNPGAIKLVHGEKAARKTLAVELEKQGYNVEL